MDIVIVVVIFTVKQCFHESFSGVGIEVIAKDTSGVLEVGEKFLPFFIIHKAVQKEVLC